MYIHPIATTQPAAAKPGTAKKSLRFIAPTLRAASGRAIAAVRFQNVAFCLIL
jgi:hypothetical protein